MVRYLLSPGIGFACFEDCGIVLDVDADRYWQLDARLAAALDATRLRGGAGVAAGDLARLERLKLIVPSDLSPPPLPESIAPMVSSSALDERFSRSIPPFRIAAIWCAAIMGWAEVRYGRLSGSLDRVRVRRTRPVTAKGDLAHLARSFARHRRAVPIPPVCLADSLAFLGLAARSGHYPALVFGVTAHPFAAHCWVQADDMVLTDTVDHISVFEPILVV